MDLPRASRCSQPLSPATWDRASCLALKPTLLLLAQGFYGGSAAHVHWGNDVSEQSCDFKHQRHSWKPIKYREKALTPD